MAIKIFHDYKSNKGHLSIECKEPVVGVEAKFSGKVKFNSEFVHQGKNKLLIVDTNGLSDLRNFKFPYEGNFKIKNVISSSKPKNVKEYPKNLNLRVKYVDSKPGLRKNRRR